MDQLETVKQQQERIALEKKQNPNMKMTAADKLMKRDVVAVYTKGTAALQLARAKNIQLTTS